MYAICSPNKNDVAKCVKEMVKQQYKVPIFQFGPKKYKELKKNRGMVMQACEKVADKTVYVINLHTLKIHHKSCGVHGKNVIGAKLTNLKNTGLVCCKKCIK